MKVSITDWSTKKYGVRSRITIQKSSLVDLPRFKAHLNKFLDKTGRESTKGVLHSLLESTRSLKYYVNGDLEDTYELYMKILIDYNKELLTMDKEVGESD